MPWLEDLKFPRGYQMGTHKKVKAGMDKDELKKLIINTYTTILARGIKGCYVYACNKNLQNYLRKFIAAANDYTLK